MTTPQCACGHDGNDHRASGGECLALDRATACGCRRFALPSAEPAGLRDAIKSLASHWLGGPGTPYADALLDTIATLDEGAS